MQDSDSASKCCWIEKPSTTSSGLTRSPFTWTVTPKSVSGKMAGSDSSLSLPNEHIGRLYKADRPAPTVACLGDDMCSRTPWVHPVYGDWASRVRHCYDTLPRRVHPNYLPDPRKVRPGSAAGCERALPGHDCIWSGRGRFCGSEVLRDFELSVKRNCSRLHFEGDYRSFGQWITTYDWEEVLNAPDTQSKTDAFYDKVHSKLEEHFPTKTIKMHCNDKPWLTPEIKNLVQQRQKAFANKQDNTWRGLRNKIQRKINKAKKRFYKTKIQALRKDNPAQWYRGIKTMLNTRAKELILQVDGVHPENPKAIADAINDVLSQVTRSLPPLDLERLPAFLPAMPPPVITPRDMYEKLRRIKVRKAPGPDGLPSRIIKEFAYELSLPMSDIVNSSLLEAHVPVQWREANIVPLPKTCPPDIDELRPVSLTPILAKVAESIICSWVLKDIAPNIDQYQFGCLKGKSTTHCLVDIVHQLAKTSDQPGSISTLVLTDFAKAYDRVDHTIAVSSILTLGLRPSLTNWLISFLTNRRHRVRYSNTFSDWRNTTCGLPQGTVLGPIIFLALINSAAENAVSMRWKFVDDLNLLECRKVREPPAIQQDLDELSKWSTEQNMKLHPKKCKVMYLNFSKSVPQLPSLKIDNYPLVQVKVAKLLGLHIQSDLKWNTQVDHMVKKGNQRLFFLRRLKTFGVTSDDLVTVYTSFVRPTCEYAVPVWQPGITQTQRL
ncbi:hypothetical protein Bbelb_082450 [Branchiostoma belcheri]|nr:hypothetical protein Bbelb_082450 [Branchiostoma belcheri]